MVFHVRATGTDRALEAKLRDLITNEQASRNPPRQKIKFKRGLLSTCQEFVEVKADRLFHALRPTMTYARPIIISTYGLAMDHHPISCNLISTTQRARR